ncbi:flagellar hook-associated protein 1 FlgK [Geodermatophilus tzadiensis]|uniref:Flagellar hook-associated protein 1 n=1 Tax=Geodermatophilus tzadiensis TaxID=1137988 RepID=A0A2T0TUQ2_9ACTN|nr:flagellar hook-associated protein FlgK [Geodermatophilus tzadiensis]PRY49424.1 flagellar hook-associated protein 1 FlgK [Geodermatophilus tzadiensis]
MSAFSALNTARTALWAAQRGLDVTGQNVANVNTEGYSRQRVDLEAMGGTAVPAVHSVSSAVDGGVDAEKVRRVRDALLEARAHLETADTARLTAESAALSRVEEAFREPGDTGLQSMLTAVWAGFSDLANSPLTLASRSQVLERLDTLASGLNTTRAALDQQWDQTRDGLATLATEVDTSTRAIAELNATIRLSTLADLPVNELADRRDALVLQLAQQIGATAVPRADGVVDVTVGGTSLVSGGSAVGVRLAGTATADGAATDPPRLVTVPGGTVLRPGGTAAGQLTALTTTVPGYRTQLDEFARSLAGTLNAAHAQGFDLAGQPGGPLFDDGSGAAPVDLSTVTAATITLRSLRPEQVAAAATDPATLGGKTSADGKNADALFRLSLDTAGLDATYRRFVVALGVESSVAARNLEVQSVISSQVDAARESVSGVNLDEEMTNMLSFQHAYNAAARMVSAIDEALDTLITRTGVVGR